MDKQHAQRIIQTTFESPFEKGHFTNFIHNLLNRFDPASFTYQGNYIPDAYKPYIASLERIGKYTDGEHTVDILIVQLKKETSLERARTMQRNFVAWYLNGSRGGELKDAALAAFVAPDETDWRFSLVKMEYRFEERPNGRMKVKEEFTPARRWSFLVGRNEASHTAQSRLVHLLADDEHNPTLQELEDAFNIESVTKEFFLKYRDLFIRTKEALDDVGQRDPRVQAEFAAKGVNTVDFAKKLLGQIVFLYFLQKKGWFGVPRDHPWGTGSKQFLRELFERKHGSYQNFFNDILEPLFYEALRLDRSHDDNYYSRFNCKIPFLNGGLFDPIGNYDWVHTDLCLPDNLFSNTRKTKEGDTGDGILDVFDRYNFTVKEDEPLEKEVAIDPELLGKAYEKFNAIRPDNFEDYKAALKSGQTGAENTFNRKFGVYYTPREIVHYMCQQSLIHYLYTAFHNGIASYQTIGAAQTDAFGNQEKTGQFDLTLEHHRLPAIRQEDFETFITFGEHVRENEAVVQSRGKETAAYKYHLPENIRQNAEQIDRALANITVCDPAVGSGAFPVGMMHEIVNARQVLATFTRASTSAWDCKRECIEHSLYGVDIDPGAVEIAKLRLWLSLVVDEDDIRQIKPLPNLDYKIVCGNSLIGFPENWNSAITREIETLKQAFFSETNPTRKNELRTRIDEKIHSRYENSQKTFGYEVKFDFRTVFSEVFHAKDGFDVVLANPPYVRQEKLKDDKPYFEKHYKTYQGMADLYVYFYEKGLQLLKSQGILSYISSNKFMRTSYGKPLRKFLSQEVSLQTVIDFGDLPVFEATAYPAILMIKKLKPPPEQMMHVLCVEEIEAIDHLTERVQQYAWFQPQNSLEIDRWNFIQSASRNLLQKLQRQGISIEKYTKGNIYRGLVTGLNEAFVIDQSTRDKLIAEDSKSAEIIKPWIIGRDVKRWRVDWQNSYLLYIPWGLAIEDYPAILNHLKQHEVELKNRPEVREGRFAWFALSRYGSEFVNEFEKPKIIYPNICKQPEFAFDDTGSFANQKCFIISIADKYLLGVLNSSITFFLFRQILPKLRGDFYEPSRVFFKDLPIVEPMPEQRTAIEDLVDRILAAKQRDPAADTRALEADIDRLVYALYGLTAEEIAIVDRQA